MVDGFLEDMDKRSLRVMSSQGYANIQVQEHGNSPDKATAKLASPFKKVSSFDSPTKSSPHKENSPLRRMGSLKKQTQKAKQENSPSPLKVFGAKKQSSPKKMLQKSMTADVNMLKAFSESP